ncbi:MAG: ABC transporter substrate-binding protein [Treponema sp.]|jgi:putative ABC transport system substrate-binding protein|nr:ABC transporter substrate-binding protein [Treponema sp.]
MKKTLAIIYLGFAALHFLAAGGQGQGRTPGQVYIGIAAYLPREITEECARGIKEAIAERGIKAEYDIQNAPSMEAAYEIANKFKYEEMDVVVGITTPMAQVLAGAIRVTPLVFAAVTDPVDAKLVSSLERGERNRTGFSDAVPIADHIALFKEAANIKTLGYIYSASEPNSVSDLGRIKEACRELGIELADRSITGPDELRQAAEEIAGRADGVYIGTDNQITHDPAPLIEVFRAAKKPVFTIDVPAAKYGGFMIASGWNYYHIGKKAGNMAADILEGKKPADIPVGVMTGGDELEFLLDLDAAVNCGIDVTYLFPKASYIYKDSALTPRAAAQKQIGIAAYLQRETMDKCEQGIRDAIAERGIKAVYDIQNVPSTEDTRRMRSKYEKMDVVVGITTPMAQALADAVKDTPLVFAAVTDPVHAKLVSSLERGERNKTGVSDAVPIEEHIALFKEAANIKTLGYIYNLHEDNSLSDLARIKKACQEQRITLVDRAISRPEDLRQAAAEIAERVDGVYLAADNQITMDPAPLIEVFRAAKKPIFTGDVTAAKNGGCIIASGWNYYQVGKKAGNIAADILEGKKPADIPVAFMTDPADREFLLDLDAAENCGIEMSVIMRLIPQANYIYKNGFLTQK